MNPASSAEKRSGMLGRLTTNYCRIMRGLDSIKASEFKPAYLAL